MLVNQTTKVVSAFILLLSIVLLVSHFPASYRKEIPFASQLPFTCFESARKVVGPFDHDLLIIAHSILNVNGSIAFNRYGDGEAGIIQNTAINAKQDSWSIPSGPSKISEHLLQTLKGHMDEPFYYGFASVDSISSLNYFLGITEQNTNYITYANLFVNSNYKITLKILNKVMAGNAGDVVILANKEGKENAWLKFKNLKRFVECPDEGPLSYEKNHLNLLDQWEELARNHTQTLFIMSCGPLAKVAVSLMWAVNKHNRYIDFGSSVDEILKGRTTRDYMRPGGLSERPDPPFSVDLNRKATIHHNFID